MAMTMLMAMTMFMTMTMIVVMLMVASATTLCITTISHIFALLLFLCAKVWEMLCNSVAKSIYYIETIISYSLSVLV